MTQTEVEEAMKKLRALWPKWTPNEQEADVWRRQFGRFHSLSVVLDGLDKAWSQSQYTAPRPKDVFASIAATAAEPSHQGHNANAELCDTGLVTTGVTKAGKRIAYRVLLYPQDPRMATMDGRYQAAAVQVAAQEKLFGVTFEAMTGDELKQLRETERKPKPKPQATPSRGGDPVVLASLLGDVPF